MNEWMNGDCGMRCTFLYGDWSEML